MKLAGGHTRTLSRQHDHLQHHMMKALLCVVTTLVMVVSMIPSAAPAYAAAQSAQTQTSSNSTSEDQSAQDGSQAGANNSAPDAGTNDANGNATTGTNDGDTSATSSNDATADVAAENATEAPQDDAANAQAAAEQAEPATPIAQIGSTSFTNIGEAVKAAQPGDTITLLEDVNLTKTGTLTITGMTLDLNGHTISADNFSLIFQGDDATIKNGNFVGTNKAAYGLFYGDSMVSHNVLIEDVNITGGINIFNSIGVTLKNVNADAAANHSPYYALWCDVNAQVTVKSGNFTSTGAAVIGLTDKSAQKPDDTLDIQGGNFYTTSSPLVLAGNRYEPVISGGTYFNTDAQKYMAQGYCLIAEDDGRYAVEAESTAVAPDADKTTLPDDLELVAIDTTPAQTHVILEDANEPTIKAELDKAGGTQHLWTANVILRNKTTLEPNHDTETSFVIAYPAGIDATNYQDYTFVVLHLKPVTDDGVVSSEPVIVPAEDVVAEEDGLHITSTLSPFAISYGLTEKPAQPTQPSKPDSGTTTPTTPDEPAVVPGDDSSSTNTGETGTTNDGSNANTPASHPTNVSDAQPIENATSASPTNAATTSPNGGVTTTNDADDVAEAVEASYGRTHVGHESVAFLANPFWLTDIVSQIWVALLGAAILALVAIVIGVVTLVRRNAREDQNGLNS